MRNNRIAFYSVTLLGFLASSLKEFPDSYKMDNAYNHIYRKLNASAELQKVTVLIADQNSNFLFAVSRFISALPGYVVVNQSIIPNILSAYKSYKPDIVLMDFAFCTSFSNFSLISELKGFSNAPRIILVAPINDPAYSEHGLSLGADGCVTRDKLETTLPNLMNQLCGHLFKAPEYLTA